MSHDPSESELAGKLREVNQRIVRAAQSIGRSPNEVRLIAVSKTKPISLIKQAYVLGQKCFGENYAQEAAEKFSELPQAEWHFIGHLQSNKAKLVVGKAAMIHSVDRVSLAQEISKIAMQSQLTQEVLLQIRIGDEETKFGVEISGALALLKAVAPLPGIRVRGIMALPPLTSDERQARAWFTTLRNEMSTLRSELSEEAARQFSELSLGTTSDFEWAIVEGATMVRVGTAIFGSRN